MILSIPSFSQGEFIAEAIKSVLRQEGDFFVDYIIVDGSSTDYSADIRLHYGTLLCRGEWPVSCSGITYHCPGLRSPRCVVNPVVY